MTKYLGMSDIFIIFVSRKGNNSSSNKKVKKSKKYLDITEKNIIFVL